jgi:hypothetical protein
MGNIRRPCGVSENGGYWGCGEFVVDMATTVDIINTASKTTLETFHP